MKLYQLAPDHKEYGERAEWWLVVSDDGEDEFAGPFKTRDEAERWIGDNTDCPKRGCMIADGGCRCDR